MLPIRRDLYICSSIAALFTSACGMPDPTARQSADAAPVCVDGSGVGAVRHISFLEGSQPASQGISTFSYPSDSAANVDNSQAFAWTEAQAAQSNFLQVGTTPGGFDLVNVGGLHSTSFWVPSLPASQTVYATIWSEIASAWFSSSISFTTSASPVKQTSSFIYPTDGATGVDGEALMSWTAAPNVDANWFEVGTSPTTHDVFSSGEIHTTGLTVGPLPTSQILYAKLWTLLSSIWYSETVSFTSTATAEIATMLTPVAGSVFDNSLAFAWPAIANAQIYQCYVGTAAGLNDIADSGQTHATSFWVPDLPASRTLYATIFTEVAGVWFSSSISFTTSASPISQISSFIYPTDGMVSISGEQNFSWTSAAHADANWLEIGTSEGAHDVLSSGEIHTSSLLVGPFPTNRQLYATLWTKLSNQWFSESISFTTSAVSQIATFLYPAPGATGVDNSQAFSFATVASSQGYWLSVGTTQGGEDIVNHDMGQSSSFWVAQLPAAKTLYGTLWTLFAGTWYQSTISFVTSASPISQISSFIYPSEGMTSVHGDQPFILSVAPHADAYWVELGTSRGAHDLLSSGEIHTTSLTVGPLPVNQVLFGTAWTRLSSVWYSQSISFTTSAGAAVAAVVGDQGAIVQTTDPTSPLAGVSVAVPADAVTGATLVTIDVAESGAADPRRPGSGVSVPVKIETSLPFFVNVSVAIPYDSATVAFLGGVESSLVIYALHNGATAWEPVMSTTVDTAAKVARAEVSQFSVMQVVLGGSAGNIVVAGQQPLTSLPPPIGGSPPATPQLLATALQFRGGLISALRQNADGVHQQVSFVQTPTDLWMRLHLGGSPAPVMLQSLTELTVGQAGPANLVTAVASGSAANSLIVARCGASNASAGYTCTNADCSCSIEVMP